MKIKDQKQNVMRGFIFEGCREVKKFGKKKAKWVRIDETELVASNGREVMMNEYNKLMMDG